MITKLLSRHFSIVCGAIWLATLVPGDARQNAKSWITLDRCQLVPNKANDGDSFHIRANDTEYLVRLYFVDAPETASVGPERLIEQAEYFGVSVPQVIEIGREAKKFVDARLSEPFTVVTRLAEGLGRSKIRRVYGFVRIKDGDLAEELVANGLARIHGVHPGMPDGSTGQDEIQKLQQLEQIAKQKKVGGWAISGHPSKLSSGTSGPLTGASSSPFAAPASSPGTVNGSPVQSKKSHAKASPESGRIDINAATEKELRMIPGIGPVMAARIIAARPFHSADDLKKVSGIGDKKYAQIRPYFR